jgi:predicted nucleic acid-binding protein
VTSGSTAGRPLLVLDTPPLHHFALADRLDQLRDLLIDWDPWSTTVVMGELKERAARLAEPRLLDAVTLDWLHTGGLDDSMDELRSFIRWSRLVGDKKDRNLGEASVFALAELRSATAITDDDDAKRVAKRHGLHVHGTLWLLAAACRDGKLTETGAANLVDLLRSTGHTLPCTGPEFPAWCRLHQLL